MPEPLIDIRALGPVAVSVGGGPAPAELQWRKNLALLIYLARSPRRSRTREHLMGLLWGDKPATSARHSLREAIRAIRGSTRDDVLAAEADQVTLADGVVALDVEELERAAHLSDWERAAGLVGGEFLEGFGVPDAGPFEDWLTSERAAIRRLAINALVRDSARLAGQGDVVAAADIATRALRLDPLSSAAARALMSACALRGDRAEALAVYDRFARAFEDATGSPPDAEIRDLGERVRRERHPRKAPETAPGAESRRAPLVGRETELAKLLGWWTEIRAGRAGALVIDGDTGSGRTRLADEVAARARLEGANTSHVRATPGDQSQPASGLVGIAAGGLLEARGVAAAAPESLACFATRLDAWGDRFPAARRASPASPAQAFSDIVRAASAEQPVLLVADDAHWLDRESLDTLHGVLRDCARQPVGLLLTAQSGVPREELDQLRSRLGRDVAGGIVKLEPLDQEALAALVRWAAPSYEAAQSARLARRVAADSAGLPLLAVELLHAVALGLDLDEQEAAWPQTHRTLDQTMPGDLPETIVAAIRMGYRRLTPNAQLAVAALAVLGDAADARAIAKATGLDAAPLADALDEAEWLRWVVCDARGYAFPARITRDVVARDMVTKGQRRRFQDALTSA